MTATPWQPTAKSRRCYHRAISGIERGGRLRFLTLTSSKDSPDTCQRSFRALYMRLKRRGLLEGYIKVPERSRNGKQHLHILFRGAYIDQALISHWWQELHNAKVVDIRAVKRGTDKRKLASDIASYMARNNSFRYSWNWNWVWRGFCRDWKELKKRCLPLGTLPNVVTFRQLLAYWQKCLWLGSPQWIYDLPPPRNEGTPHHPYQRAIDVLPSYL